jgi:geranylgeranyl diphosphate synthase, type II
MDILNTTQTKLADWQRIVEMRLDQETSASPQVPAQLTGSIRHSILGSAKRVRALIVLALATDLGHDESKFLSTASAIEMVHAASLVLDDLPCMDDAKQRRGQATTHRAYGDANAILAAIALIARAYEVIAQDASLHADARTSILCMLAAAMGSQGLTGGLIPITWLPSIGARQVRSLPYPWKPLASLPVSMSRTATGWPRPAVRLASHSRSTTTSSMP